MTGGGPVPAPLWVPDEDRQAASHLRRYLDRHGFEDYDTAWQWSVAADTAGGFWRSVAEEFAVTWHESPEFELQRQGADVYGARWFGGGRLNYAEGALAPGTGSPDALAVIARSQTRLDRDLTWRELTDLVARIRSGLEASGVGPGDRVAACLPNIPETLAAMLACASLGAVWTCCAPEMGVTGILDRLAQVDPVVLLAIDGYRYGGRTIERRDQNEALRSGLPTLTRAVWLGYLHPDGDVPDGWTPWAELTGERGPLRFTPVAFDHPLYILFSSGTTGKPKPIVHGHGGILLEHAKVLGLHFDLGPDDRFFWYTTTGWMMWNFCMSGLLVGSAVVTFDGDPAWPEPGALWGTMAQTATTHGGVGAGYLVAGMKTGMRPGASHDLGRLRTLGSTGSPLPAAAAAWVYEAVAGDLLLASISGGTDVCTAFVGGSPLHPVWAGEISCRCLGAAVEVFDDEGLTVIDEEGELVLTAPLPSMPVEFWGDEDGSRYRAAYFDRFPRVWAHGDRATVTGRGTCIITGRSDGTLNRGGVRIGTAEFYDVVERFDEVADSLVVHLEDPAGGPGEVWLFVVVAGPGPAGPGPAGPGPEEPLPAGPAPGATAGPDDLTARLKAALRRDLSPRHVPDRVLIVPQIPRTLSGKKLEVPIKRILSGVPTADALTVASVANPESLAAFAALAGDRADQPDRR
jgi:acetoacetyl-CoA synthetase